jgi:hypothetical protein
MMLNWGKPQDRYSINRSQISRSFTAYSRSFVASISIPRIAAKPQAGLQYALGLQRGLASLNRHALHCLLVGLLNRLQTDVLIDFQRFLGAVSRDHLNLRIGQPTPGERR